ncbi:MAG: MBL fold metallo-hydrolase, partial [Myxococcota bacterium]|nr:MBL fold metallo-hydrolase [Myxococcota bacterium]MEE2779812.1 MBL fold metallo-hydrolase [Myxococcota bacterium]
SDCQGPKNLQLFLTHPHWDHVLGYPYFRPFYDERFDITIHGADSENKTLEDIFSTQHKAGNFPVPFQELRASITLNRLQPGTTIRLGDLEVQSLQLNHPGVDLGYRFQAEHASAVLLTDLAPIRDNLLGDGMARLADDNSRAFEQDHYSGLVDFVKGADLVLHDTNFTEEEIVGKRHWGHSTPDDALKLLSHHDAPPALVLTHHDPDHNDEIMDAIYEETKKKGREMGVDVLIAKEGEVFDL